MSNFIRVIIPDSHGSMIDTKAAKAFLADLKKLRPKEIVLLGDHVDASGIFSVHLPHALEERTYSYTEDCNAANAFLDSIQRAAPNASIDYIEGNHESHIERWIARLDLHQRDRELLEGVLAPAAMLRLRARGIKYYKSAEFHHGLSIPGTIKKGKCYFTHGTSCGRFATAQHLSQFGSNVVHGHTHRAQAHSARTVSSGEIGSWCPGTLAQLQPLYMHTALTNWSHGYALQLVERSGKFLHIQVPILKGHSLLQPLLKTAG